MNILSGMRVYLSGPIDKAKDDGKQWRDELKELCFKKNILLSFLDPCDKPSHLLSRTGGEKTNVNKLKEFGEEKWDELQKVVKNIKKVDYRMVNVCDLFILYADPETYSCGSYFECKLAEDEEKPILFILPSHLKKTDIPSWLIDIADWDKIFTSVIDCIDYLDKINNGKIDIDEKWIKVF